MSAPPQMHDPLLRTAHRGTLAFLAACAIFIVAQGGNGTADFEPYPFTTAALCLAIVSIVGRRTAQMPGREQQARRVLECVGLIAAAGIAIAAVVAGFAGSDRQDGLLFILGAAILSLRPPATMPAPSMPAPPTT